jgi:hypothetical protein
MAPSVPSVPSVHVFCACQPALCVCVGGGGGGLHTLLCTHVDFVLYPLPRNIDTQSPRVTNMPVWCCCRYAAVLARACVKSKQLQQGELTRAELMSIGIPLGVAAQLVPLSDAKSALALGGGGASPTPSSES